MMRYICQICGFVYEEDAPGKVPFAELPGSWKCPLCGAAKSDFKAEEAAAVSKKAAVQPVEAVLVQPIEAVLKELSCGQLAALFSNLARGCEKQYRPEEAGLFRELADYFTAVTPEVNDVSVEKLAAELQSDIDRYADVRAAADAASDRGAARICVWGEKVTRMLLSLVSRYLEEGEDMLAGSGIWVCSACGFIYVGEEAPELCPVCKVPAWKFEKIEGRA
ncbi:MAG: rubredoxin [Lachnospiraceae bacterium]|nr:rubredoxin [Lachnospiraceae bacterium]